jgi:hypothetical protein
MANAEKILLVEGASDKLLFSVICEFTKIDPVITVVPPREIGRVQNSKGGVFTVLPTLLNQLPDGKIKRLAIIVDADHPENHGMGYRKTLEEFSGLVREAGYNRINPKGLRASSRNSLWA